MKLRSPIVWVGGKSMMVEKLLKYVPPHRVYVEVFGGGASLLFAKDPSPVEVYNDIDEGLVNFFRVLRDPEKFEKFYLKVCLTPYARAEYKYCRNTWKECVDDVEMAYRWYVALRMSFGSKIIGKGWAYNITTSGRGMAGAVSKWRSAIEGLPKMHERFLRVRVECLDFRKLVSIYDAEDTFFYLDPPYFPKTRREKRMYTYEMSIEDHKDLIKLLLKVRGMAMLSGYQNDIYEELEKNGWVRKDFKSVCKVLGRTRYTGVLGKGSASQKASRIESIWLNPQLIERLSINLEFLDIKTLK